MNFSFCYLSVLISRKRHLNHWTKCQGFSFLLYYLTNYLFIYLFIHSSIDLYAFCPLMGWWKSKVAYEMHLLSCFCILRKLTRSWRMAPLALLLLFSSYRLVGVIFLSLIFTSLTLLCSTIVFMWKHGRENVVPTRMHNHETVRHVKESDDVSDADHTPDCSDGTISDEDSLIEISLPSGHFVGHNQRPDSNFCTLQQKKRELSAHETLMELLAEFNEEENLIEIDIAMGSIKCSSFWNISMIIIIYTYIFCCQCFFHPPNSYIWFGLFGM